MAIYSIQSIILSAIILGIMLSSILHNRAHVHLTDWYLFRFMLLASIVILVSDGMTFLLDGNPSRVAYIVNVCCTTVTYALTPTLPFLYINYCDYKLEAETSRVGLSLYFVPLLVNCVLAFLSPKYGLLFNLDANNVYHRGSLFSVSFIISYLFLAVAFCKILYAICKNGIKSNLKNLYAPLLFFPIPQVIGSLLQIYNPDLPIIWVCNTVSMLIIFIYVQNAEISLDALTGLYNRKKLVPYIKWKVSKLKKHGKRLFLVMIDIDGLKSINDVFGHVTGDKAIVATANVLQSKVAANDFLCRYGGDEFVIVAERNSEKEIAELLADIEKSVDTAAETEDGYTLSLSTGFSEWTDGSNSPTDFVNVADKYMYRKKSAKKSTVN